MGGDDSDDDGGERVAHGGHGDGGEVGALSRDEPFLLRASGEMLPHSDHGELPARGRHGKNCQQEELALVYASTDSALTKKTAEVTTLHTAVGAEETADCALYPAPHEGHNSRMLTRTSRQTERELVQLRATD